METIDLYRQLSRARAFELALASLWQAGLISGEMHLGTGEEAVDVGVAAHLEPGADAVALDHRPTPVLVALGADLRKILLEVMGHKEGLGGGQGGHMHLFDRERMAASSGIVGAAGPAACGFALAARQLRPGRVAVGFFGEGAANQGMLLESLNLAAAWSLPVVFVCKDNEWSITTRTQRVTGGNLAERAAGFGMRSYKVDGLDVEAMHEAAGDAVAHARKGRGPSFVLARCSRLDGHFLGDSLVRTAAHPISEGKEQVAKIASGMLSRGGALGDRVGGVLRLLDSMRRLRRQKRDTANDPLVRARRKLALRREEVAAIDAEAHDEIEGAVEAALGEVQR
ncbi:thiamine pyrophosphate-dependent dehydrogenase E1 component subunit alpha [Persicimonas caeni]|uniref:Thiamine pyrophosphate-dependent dehydrogenase E1 component subunit alpha n=1 Tax=Persicimonas caeni TaxID=2292766 RepID=A0A4Y6PQM8_PERCE|nr:thiamine pyrophosphate-dependent dehydrogenase E1 component subunit alpha [Persicimonas caeni]QDG50642.1 thiamine pyrophosphate-dependent dehydrogenase E1 component subunit alpha [Persicimonas caeni]QED31863.1 thiamine pyrophosphate-dependent dehydrogenase E1 component subunit alpha [Persicimonas caeni]